MGSVQAYGRGLHRPDPAKLARRVDGFLPRVARAALRGPRGSAQLTPCPRLDQGSSGTCHAHSAAGAIWTAFAAVGKTLSFIPSPLLIASCTYADVQGPSDTRGPLQDTGADLSDDATALATWGIGPMGAPTSDGRNSDVENVFGSFPEPDAGKLVIAGADLIVGEYAIPIDTNTPARCALNLDAGVPLWVGFLCDSRFQQLGPSDVAGAPDQGDPSAGGHAVYLAGYRTVGSALQFRLENSWGSSWCDAGACWVSEDWIRALWMCWPMAVAGGAS